MTMELQLSFLNLIICFASTTTKLMTQAYPSTMLACAFTTPDLCAFPNIVVMLDKHRHNRHSQYRSTGDQHQLLGHSVRLLDDDTLRRISGVGQLLRERLVDNCQLGLRRLGKTLAQLFGEHTLSDGSSNGKTDTTADARVHVLDSEDDGNELILNRSHGGSLLADDKGVASEGDKDLAHDKVTDVGVDSSELEQQTNTENGEAHIKEEGKPLEATVMVDKETDGDTPKTRAGVVDAAHPCLLHDRQALTT